MSDAQVETVEAAKAAKPAEKKPEVVAEKPAEMEPKTASAKPAEKQPKAAAPAPEAGPMVPESVREVVETSVTKAKESYEQAKATAEEATEALEETFAAAMRAANEFNEQIMAAFKDDASAQFDLMRDLTQVGTPVEAFELQGKFLRSRLEAVQARSTALAELVSRVTEETAAPTRESMLKTIRTLTPAA